MRERTARGRVAGLLILALGGLGCDEAASEVASEEDAGPTTLQVYTFTVQELPDPLSPGGMPLASVVLCEYGFDDNCATTDGGGRAAIALLGRDETGVVFEGDGHARTLFPAFPIRDLRQTIEIPSSTLTSTFAGLVGIDWPVPERGVIAVSAIGPGPDTMLALDPIAGEGPFYAADNSIPDPTRTTFSSFGLGFVTGLDPGTYEATVEGCVRENGWPARRGGTARVPVEADTLTILLVTCP